MHYHVSVPIPIFLPPHFLFLHRHFPSVNTGLCFKRTHYQGGSITETLTKPGHPSFVNGRQTILFILHTCTYQPRAPRPGNRYPFICLSAKELTIVHTRLAKYSRTFSINTEVISYNGMKQIESDR